MDNKNKININDMPKWFRVILALFPLMVIVNFTMDLDNDFYFLYPTGEYIVNNGLPTHDFLSMHNGMEIIAQQWLSTVVLYYAYSTIGIVGVYLVRVLAYIAFVAIMLKLCKLVSNNHFVSCVCTLVAGYLVSSYFPSRPQIFTYVILLLELYLLEKYVHTGKIISLAFIPILSVAQVNMHSSMWVLIFVLMLPYLVAAVPFHIGKLRNESCCKLLPLIATFVVSFGVGFLNPYGLKAMTYILSSFGYEEISKLISEMQPITINDLIGAELLISIAVFGTIILLKKEELNVRYLLLFGGLAVFSLMSYKSVPYFYIGAVPVLAYYIRDWSFSLSMKKSSSKSKILLLVALIVAVMFVGYALIDSSSYQTEAESEEEITTYAQLDKAIEILDAAPEEIVLFANFDNGQYLEFNGYHPYIDGRAELFLKDNNNEYDYMKEYYNIENANLYYKTFLDKYHFNYLIVSVGDSYLYNSLLHDDDYEILYNGHDEHKAFIKKQGKNKNSKNNNDSKTGSDILLFALKDR